METPATIDVELFYETCNVPFLPASHDEIEFSSLSSLSDPEIVEKKIQQRINEWFPLHVEELIMTFGDVSTRFKIRGGHNYGQDLKDFVAKIVK